MRLADDANEQLNDAIEKPGGKEKIVNLIVRQIGTSRCFIEIVFHADI